MSAERARVYDALVGPRVASDYSATMSLADFEAEAAARADVHPWLPQKRDVEASRKMREAMALLGAGGASALDDVIAELLAR